MTGRNSLVRRFLSGLVLILLLLQGMTAASAGVPEFGRDMQHCSDHQAAGGDCPCCSEAEMIAGCAVGCAFVLAMPAEPIPAPRTTLFTPGSVDDQSFLSAVHPPPDPPPIR